MPKLKRKADKYDALRQLILGRMATDGVDLDKLGGYIGCSRQTASRKLTDPGSMTLRELAAISRGLQIPIEDMRDNIPY